MKHTWRCDDEAGGGDAPRVWSDTSLHKEKLLLQGSFLPSSSLVLVSVMKKFRMNQALKEGLCTQSTFLDGQEISIKESGKRDARVP